MTVTPIPAEDRRYLVQSRSRPEMRHLVDLAYDEVQDGKPRKGKPACSCEAFMARGQSTCPHIEAAKEYEKRNGGYDQTQERITAMREIGHGTSNANQRE